MTLKTIITHIPGIRIQYPVQQNRLYSQRIVSVYFNLPGDFLKDQLKGLPLFRLAQNSSRAKVTAQGVIVKII